MDAKNIIPGIGGYEYEAVIENVCRHRLFRSQVKMRMRMMWVNTLATYHVALEVVSHDGFVEQGVSFWLLATKAESILAIHRS